MCQPKFLPEAPVRSKDPVESSKKRKAPSTPTAAASRSKALTLEELQENFHLPINEVASKLGVCVTVLKQQCRELGIVRWPYRKVRKLDNMLSALESSRPGKARPFALSNGESERQQKITTVKKTLMELIADPNSCAHLKLGKVKNVAGSAGAGAGAAGAASASAACPASSGSAKQVEEWSIKADVGLLSRVEDRELLTTADVELFTKADVDLFSKARDSDSSTGLGGSSPGVMEAASALVWGPHLPQRTVLSSLDLKSEAMSSPELSAVPPLSTTDVSTLAASRWPLSNQSSAGMERGSFLSLMKASMLSAEEEDVRAQVSGGGGASAGSISSSISGSNSFSSRHPVQSGVVSEGEGDGEGRADGREQGHASEQSSVELDLISRLGCDRAAVSISESAAQTQAEAPADLHRHPSMHEDFGERSAALKSSPVSCTRSPSSQGSHPDVLAALAASTVAPHAEANAVAAALRLQQREMMLSGFASSAAGSVAVGQPGAGELRGVGGLNFAGSIPPAHLSGLVGGMLTPASYGFSAADFLHLQRQQLLQLEAQQQQQSQLLALIASSGSQQQPIQSFSGHPMTAAALASLGFAPASHGLGHTPQEGLSLPIRPLFFFPVTSCDEGSPSKLNHMAKV